MEKVVREHYCNEAKKYGDSSKSTMDDEIVRERELQMISNFLKLKGKHPKKVLDLGCGNGYCLERMSKEHPKNQYYGLDFSKELIDIAKKRDISCKFLYGDVIGMEFEENSFDIVYTERCLINIFDWNKQKKALKEIHRVLKPQGHYLMIECFTDGLENNNRARKECGLSELKSLPFNKYFDKGLFLQGIQDFFTVKDLKDFPNNFL